MLALELGSKPVQVLGNILVLGPGSIPVQVLGNMPVLEPGSRQALVRSSRRLD